MHRNIGEWKNLWGKLQRTMKNYLGMMMIRNSLKVIKLQRCDVNTVYFKILAKKKAEAIEDDGEVEEKKKETVVGMVDVLLRCLVCYTEVRCPWTRPTRQAEPARIQPTHAAAVPKNSTRRTRWTRP